MIRHFAICDGHGSEISGLLPENKKARREAGP
jgi:hypothetical protein